MNIEPIFWTLVTGMFIYEFVTLYWTSKPDDHITAIIRDRLSKRPLVPFAFGMLCGHLFWCW